MGEAGRLRTWFLVFPLFGLLGKKEENLVFFVGAETA